MKPITDYYFECHITIEPVFDDRLELFKRIASHHRFRVAELLMKKKLVDNLETSKYDTFCTSRDVVYSVILDNMINMIGELKRNYFKVFRYKIENTLLDSRENDMLDLL